MENSVKKEKTMKGLAILPFVLFILFAVASFCVGIAGFIYSIVTYLAFESPMVFLILFGCFVLFTGIGILLIDCFIRYKKKYDDKYNPRDVEEAEPATTTIVEKKKFKLDFQTICYGVMVVGAVFIIISAGLGSIFPNGSDFDSTTPGTVKDGSWKQVIGDYRVSKGYNRQAAVYELPPHGSVEKIVLDLKDKNVVVKYTNKEFVTLTGYSSFPGHLTSSFVAGTLRIVENTKPSIEGDTVAEMLSFLFSEHEFQSQIIIFIPLSQKDSIEIVGEYIVAQD